MDSIERDLMLAEGKMVGDYWFNEKSAQSFITLVVFAQANGLSEIDWPNKDRNWVAIPIGNAVDICVDVINEIQAIYRVSGDDTAS